MNLTLKNNNKNVWFKEYWEETHNCVVENVLLHNCTKHKYEQEGLVQFVIDSVYALAHALHNYLHSKCTSERMKDCHLLNSPDREELLKFIRNVSFKGRMIINNVCQIIFFMIYSSIIQFGLLHAF